MSVVPVIAAQGASLGNYGGRVLKFEWIRVSIGGDVPSVCVST